MHFSDIEKAKLYLKNPKPLIISGDYKSGKSDLVDYIVEELKLPMETLNTKISPDYIEEMYLRSSSWAYKILIDDLSEKDQNSLLKLVEEPPLQSVIILITSNKNKVISTLRNRCSLIEMHIYRREELIQYCINSTNKVLLDICTSPYQLEEFSKYDIDKILGLCENIITKMRKAALPNALSIFGAYMTLDKESYEKCDVRLFVLLFLYTLHIKLLEGFDKNLYDIYIITLKFKKELENSRYKIDSLFDNYILDLWKISRR